MFYYLLIFLRQGLTVQFYLAQNLICTLGWPRSQRSACLCLVNIGIKKYAHHTQIIYFLNYIQMSVLPTHLSTCTCRAFTSQKTALDPQEVKLQAVVSYYVGQDLNLGPLEQPLSHLSSPVLMDIQQICTSFLLFYILYNLQLNFNIKHSSLLKFYFENYVETSWVIIGQCYIRFSLLFNV